MPDHASPDYTLSYWSVPFRGQFVRAVLAFAGKTWREAGDEAIGKLMEGSVADMPVPFMGPPMLVDHKTGFAIAQMPAIVFYLGETLAMLPMDLPKRALALKIVNDANDVIDEMTQQGGREMWTEASWREFQPRLRKWMSFWEETGRRHGLKPDSGFLLGGDIADVADVVTATLWSTMIERLPTIAPTFEQTAPMTAALVHRMAALPSLKHLAEDARRQWGDDWCGGEIGKSLKQVAG